MNLSTKFRFSDRKSQSQQNYQKRTLISQYIFTQKVLFLLQTLTHSTL